MEQIPKTVYLYKMAHEELLNIDYIEHDEYIYTSYGKRFNIHSMNYDGKLKYQIDFYNKNHRSIGTFFLREGIDPNTFIKMLITTSSQPNPFKYLIRS